MRIYINRRAPLPPSLPPSLGPSLGNLIGPGTVRVSETARRLSIAVVPETGFSFSHSILSHMNDWNLNIYIIYAYHLHAFLYSFSAF